MKFAINREIDKNLFSTIILFEEYGTKDMIPKQEKAMIADYAPALEYKNIDFTGKFSVVAGDVVEDVSGEEISLMLNNVKIDIDENFEVRYSIDANKISDSEVGSVLSNKALVAQAKCILFENKIQEEIGRILEEARSKVNTFEKDLEIVL